MVVVCECNDLVFRSCWILFGVAFCGSTVLFKMLCVAAVESVYHVVPFSDHKQKIDSCQLIVVVLVMRATRDKHTKIQSLGRLHR